MPQSFQAVFVLAIALLPGALAIWGFESATTKRSVTQGAEGFLRFIGVSAAFQALLLPLTYSMYSSELHSHRLRDGKPLPAWFWVGAVAYVTVPWILGRIVGFARQRGWRVGRYFTPFVTTLRPWDYAFRHSRDSLIRLRLKSSQEWLVGVWGITEEGHQSYYAQSPWPETLFLAQTVQCDPTTGEITRGPDDRPIIRPFGLLIRWEEVQYLEFLYWHPEARYGRLMPDGQIEEISGRDRQRRLEYPTISKPRRGGGEKTGPPPPPA